MQLNIKKILKVLFLALCCFIAGFILWLWLTTPPVEEVDVYSDQVTILEGQTKQIIKDISPDPSWLRFNLVSEDPDIVETKDDKYSVEGIKAGSVIIYCMDKKKVIKEIRVKVIPYK